LKERTVVLTQKDKVRLVEGKQSKFELEILEGTETYTNNSIEGTVTTEDINFDFTSKDGKTKFHHFMDEINEASLTVDGSVDGDYVCH
jgi:flagellar capping protein FliD